MAYVIIYVNMANKRLKYWVLATEFPPYYGGGISTYYQHTVAALQDQYEVTVFLPDESISKDILVEQKDTYNLVRFKSTLKPPKLPLGWVAATSYCFYMAIEHMIKNDGAPDIIETQDYQGVGYFTIHKKKELNPYLEKTKIILVSHGPSFINCDYEEAPNYALPGYWTQYMEKYCYLNADGVIFASKCSKTLVENKLNNIAPNTIIPHPFKHEASSIGGGAAAISDQVAYIGRIQRFKGVEDLMELMKKNYWDVGHDIKLTLIGGSGSYYAKNIDALDYLKNKYKDYFERGLIKTTGQISSEKIKDFVRTAKAVIIPSKVEAFSYVTCEQMSNGKVLLVSNTGGQSEIVEDGKSGFVYKDNREFKRKLDLALGFSRGEYLRFTKKAQERIGEMCSYKNVFTQKNEFIRKTLNTKDKADYNFVFENTTDARQYKVKTSTQSPNRKFVKGLLSVVIPYYNTEQYTGATIDSLVNVDYEKTEIIIVNDGSTRESAIAKLDELKQMYPQLKIVDKPNGGLASARNFGFQHVRGEFTAIIDSDDKVTSNFYSRAVAILDRYKNIDFIGTHIQNFDQHDGMWPTWDTELPYLLFHNSLSSSCLVYRTKALLDGGANDPIMKYGMEDYDSVLSMVERGHKAIVITDPNLIYRITPGSMSQQFNYNCVSYLTELIAVKHAGLYSAYADQLACLYNESGPGILTANPTWETATTQLAKRLLNTKWIGAQKSLNVKIKGLLTHMHILDIAIATRVIFKDTAKLVKLIGKKTVSLIKKLTKSLGNNA